MKVAILGYGDRGTLYGDLFQRNGVEISAVCDLSELKLERAVKNLKLAKENCYLDENSFWRQGKLADLLVISTLDQHHYAHAIKAMEVGYDILLEKPIAPTLEECKQIEALAKEKGTKIYLCYVLRYAPFFMKMKEILDSGRLGKLISINQTEGVAYWHQAHSFVRGNWRNSKESTPMIIAKCSHDLDILRWFAEAEPKAVSSMGDLSFFKEENAPKEAAKYCCDCPLGEECAYNNFKWYKEYTWWIAKTGYYNGDWEDKEGVKKCLEDKNNPYSRCVFYCDNDVVDNQVTNIEFKNGVTAHLTMTAFTHWCYRKTHVHCSYGDMYGNMEDNKITVNVFGKEQEVIDLGETVGLAGHGGGDAFMIKRIVDAYQEGQVIEKNGLSEAMCSHYLGFAAEESRLANGKKIEFH